MTVRALRPRACHVYCQRVFSVMHPNNSRASVTTTTVRLKTTESSKVVNLLKEIQFKDNFEDRYQDRYDTWKAGKGPPPKDVLLDADGNEVISPKIDPDFCIQGGNDGRLPPALQHAVDQHVYWACQHEYAIPRGRHFARHHKLDSRSSQKKSRKKSLKKELVVTPFVLIGAYQRLLKRAQQYPYGCVEI